MPLVQPLRRLRRTEGYRAFFAGQRAKTAGKPVTVCPYDPNSSDVAEQWRLRAWLRGYHTDD